jgi:hypothetical protein
LLVRLAVGVDHLDRGVAVVAAEGVEVLPDERDRVARTDLVVVATTE